MTQEAGPEYQRLMALIRSRITSGEYPMGGKIPSTSDWIQDGWSRDTTRTAITRLQQEGILKGQGGKAVYVKATPEQAVREHASLEALSEEMATVRQRAEAGPDDLRAWVGHLEVNLIDLYAKLGFEYPHDDAKTARRGRAAG